MGALEHREAVVDYQQQSLMLARQNIPPTLRWTGAVVVAFALVNEIVPPPTEPHFFITLTTLGAAILGLGLWFRSPRAPALVILWTYIGVIVLLNASLLLMFNNRPATWDFMYVVIVITGFAPLAFRWSAFVVGSGLSLLMSVAVLLRTHTEHASEWTIGIATAMVAGAFLLRQRMQFVRELADAQFAREQLVESDVLTGLFNRRGIYSRIEVLWASALRRSERINIAFIDIVGLKRANDSHGHELGDRIIVEVAEAIQQSTRRDDLVARWGGDEFVVLSRGEVDSTEHHRERILGRLKLRDAVFAGRWPSDISVGAASALAQEAGFDELLERADADMYARRQQAQG